MPPTSLSKLNNRNISTLKGSGKSGKLKLLPRVLDIGVITKTRFPFLFSQYQANKFHILADN